MLTLQSLIKQATTYGSEACRQGKHTWNTEGGRTCPKGIYEEREECSQTVYVCAVCGVYDHGERGGPGYKECFVDCRRIY